MAKPVGTVGRMAAILSLIASVATLVVAAPTCNLSGNWVGIKRISASVYDPTYPINVTIQMTGRTVRH